MGFNELFRALNLDLFRHGIEFDRCRHGMHPFLEVIMSVSPLLILVLHLYPESASLLLVMRDAISTPELFYYECHILAEGPSCFHSLFVAGHLAFPPSKSHVPVR